MATYPAMVASYVMSLIVVAVIRCFIRALLNYIHDYIFRLLHLDPSYNPHNDYYANEDRNGPAYKNLENHVPPPSGISEGFMPPAPEKSENNVPISTGMSQNSDIRSNTQLLEEKSQ